MKRTLAILLLGCTAVGVSSPALAGNNAQAGIAVHLTWFNDTKTVCEDGKPADNASVVTTMPGPGIYNAYFLVCNGSHRNAETQAAIGGPGFDTDGTGVSAVEFGIHYSEPDLFLYGWSSCTDGIDFLSPWWPQSGQDATITWNTCQGVSSPPTIPNNVIAVAGFCHVDASGGGHLEIFPKFSSGLATVSDCGAVLDIVDSPALGVGGFGTPGYSPCGVITPVEETTWGEIKKQFD